MPTIGLSKPNAVTPVSDPVHGRIELTIFDRDLVDHRYFQRLHFILQNSVNYVSFPSNKNTRFPHSLGVAHLCGRMFASALNNSDSRTLKSFLDTAADFLIRLQGVLSNPKPVGLVGAETTENDFHSYLTAHKATISGRANFLHIPLSLSRDNGSTILGWQEFGTGEIKLPAEFIVDSFWQAVRLYGLVHDLGHLPMSHAFETAVKKLPHTLKALGGNEDLNKASRKQFMERRDHLTGLNNDTDSYFSGFGKLLDVGPSFVKSVSQGKELHETRGISLYNIFISKFSHPSACFDSTCSRDIDRYGLLIHHLTLCILLSSSVAPSKSDKKRKKSKTSPHRHSFLYAIKRIVDGQVDGDRLDYTVRDSHEAGLTSGIFDFDRIVDFSVLCSDHDREVFSFGFFHRALPALEQFFEARYQCYKYQIFHRTSVRSNKCVEELISTLLSFAFLYPDTVITEVLVRYGYVRLEDSRVVELLPVVLDFIEKIDDSTLRSLLFEIKELSVEPQLQTSLKERNDGSFQTLMVIRHLSDVVLFRDFAKICSIFKGRSLKSLITEAIGSTPNQESIKKLAVHLLDNEEDFVDVLRRSVWRKSADELGEPVLVFSASTTAKIFDAGVDQNNGNEIKNLAFEEDLWIVDTDGSREKVASKSPSLRTMYKRKADDKRSFVYAVGRDLKSPSSAERRLVEMEALSLIKNAYIEIDEGEKNVH